MTPIQIVFILVAAATLGSALMVVTSRNLVHSALWLIASLFGIAIFFAILNAGFLAIVDLVSAPNLLKQLPIYFAGFFSAALVGYFAIRWFISYLSKQSLYLFAGYCAILGTTFLLLISFA